MELPEHLKNLYRHWAYHSNNVPGNAGSVDAIIPQEILWFIRERIEVWKKKTSGAPGPYTTDPILARYRFCNIFREFDRQTIEFHRLLNPLRDDFSLWLLNMFYCRMVARPETIQKLGFLSFDDPTNKVIYECFLALDRPRFGTPYVFPVSCIQKSPFPTRERFITQFLPLVMPRIADEIQSWHKKSVFDGVQTILPLFGFNLSFLWTEVLIDTAYQYPEQIDLFKQFPIGPGAKPTFKIISPNIDPSIFVRQLATLPFETSLTFEGKRVRLSAENWEGIGCEFRKYTNLKQGRGRKRLYAFAGQHDAS